VGPGILYPRLRAVGNALDLYQTLGLVSNYPEWTLTQYDIPAQAMSSTIDGLHAGAF